MRLRGFVHSRGLSLISGLAVPAGNVARNRGGPRRRFMLLGLVPGVASYCWCHERCRQTVQSTLVHTRIHRFGQGQHVEIVTSHECKGLTRSTCLRRVITVWTAGSHARLVTAWRILHPEPTVTSCYLRHCQTRTSACCYEIAIDSGHRMHRHTYATCVQRDFCSGEQAGR